MDTIYTPIRHNPEQMNLTHQVTEAEIDLIKNSYWKVLCTWYEMLNSWEWPDDLLPCDDGGTYFKDGRRSKLMRLIENRVGKHTILRMHNKDRMTADEFEDFWQGTKCGDMIAKGNCNYRTMKSIAKQMGVELETIYP